MRSFPTTASKARARFARHWPSPAIEAQVRIGICSGRETSYALAGQMAREMFCRVYPLDGFGLKLAEVRSSLREVSVVGN